MGIYISGCFVAFIIYAILLINSLTEKYSLMSKNFEKIGFFYSLSSSKYELKNPSKSKEILSVIWNLFLNVVLSRISVVFIIYGLIKKYNAKSDTPDKMKEVTFKIKNQNLSKDEMLSLWDKGNEYLGYNERDYIEKYLEDETKMKEDENELELYRSSDGFSDLEYIRVIPCINRIFKTRLSTGYDNDDVFEYRITGTKVLVRCMQSDNIIKNGKINKLQLKDSYSSWHHEETEKEYIERVQKLCERHLIHDLRISTFVLVVEERLKRDFEKMSKDEFNAMIDSRIKGLKQGKKELEDLCEKLGLPKDDKDGFNLDKSEKMGKGKEYNEGFHKICEKYGCSRWQLVHDTEKTINELNSYKL